MAATHVLIKVEDLDESDENVFRKGKMIDFPLTLNDVMNLGMCLRQDQLSGYSGKSGNEVLEDYKKEKT
jgi:hypothetical protein